MDVVFNHMSGNWPHARGQGGSTANPNHKEYHAVPYGQIAFHSTCTVDNYNDADNVSIVKITRTHL